MIKVQSPAAELSVLRGMVSKDKKIAGTLLSLVDESYFSFPETSEIYTAIKRHLADSGETPTYKLMLRDPEISREARDHFRDSQAEITTVKEAEKHARNLNKYRRLRGMYNLAAGINHEFQGSKVDIDKLIDQSATALNIIRSKKSTHDSFLHFGKNNNSMSIVDSILDDDNSEAIIPTGIKAFDEASGGFARGALVTIGASSGGGKSLCANTMAKNMATMGYKVLVVPLEMSKREMTCRLMANVTSTDLTKIMLQRLATGEKELVRKRMRKWMKKVKFKGGRYTIFKPSEDMTIEEIMAAVSAYSCDVVIVDYISLLKGVDGDDQWQALGAAARYAKINAENENRVNILLCQVSEDGKIRYARSISEHSSNSWIWVASKEATESGVMRIEQPKSRNSMSFPFTVRMNWAFMRMEDMPQDEDDSLGPVDEDDDSKKDKKKKKKRMKNLADDGPDV